MAFVLQMNSFEDRYMTIRTLLNIILKVLGLFLILEILASFTQLVTATLYLTASGNTNEAIWTFITSLVIIVVYGISFYFLVFRSNDIVTKLKLEKDIDQDSIPLTIHHSTILSISIIVIGGFILVNEIPNFCQHLLSYFYEKRMTYGMTKPDISHSVLAAAKILIGLLLIGNQKLIVNFIEHRRRN